MAGQAQIRPTALVATLAAACALALGACGGDDGDPEAAATDDVTDATDAAPGTDTDGAGFDPSAPCGALTDDAVAAVLGEVTATGGYGGTPEFGRGDGSGFDYVADGCTIDVAVDGDDDPHSYTVSTGTPVDAGIDLFEEFRTERDPEDLRPVEGLGDDAFVDTTFGGRRVALIVRSGDTVLFVDSRPPFGVPVADDEVLVALAELTLGES